MIEENLRLIGLATSCFASLPILEKSNSGDIEHDQKEESIAFLPIGQFVMAQACQCYGEISECNRRNRR